MRALLGVAAALVVAVAAGVWLNTASQSGTEISASKVALTPSIFLWKAMPVPGVSIWEPI